MSTNDWFDFYFSFGADHGGGWALLHLPEDDKRRAVEFFQRLYNGQWCECYTEEQWKRTTMFENKDNMGKGLRVEVRLY